MPQGKTSFMYRPEVKCPFCGAGMARSLQVIDGTLKPLREGVLTCCNPTCNIKYDTHTDTAYQKGKVFHAKA